MSTSLAETNGLDPDEAHALRACDRAAEAVAALEPEQWAGCVLRIVGRLRSETATARYAKFLNALITQLDIDAIEL